METQNDLHPTANELIDRLVSVARTRLGMELSWLSSFVGDEQVFDRMSGTRATFGMYPGASSELAGSYCARVQDGRLPNLIADSSANPVTAALSITEKANIGSYVGVPVRGPDGTAQGMLCCVNSGTAHHLDSEDVKTLEMVAELIGEVLRADGSAWLADGAQGQRMVAATCEHERSCVGGMDFLTSIANRSRAQAELDALAAGESGFAVLFCDVRSFKKFNDEFGHAAGDHVLRVIAQRLTAVVGSRDLVGRWGGDEFLVLVHEESQDNVLQLRHELVEATSQPVQLPNSSIVVYPHLTIGCAARAKGAPVVVEELLHRADSDMYRQRRMALRGISAATPAPLAQV